MTINSPIITSSVQNCLDIAIIILESSGASDSS